MARPIRPRPIRPRSIRPRAAHLVAMVLTVGLVACSPDGGNGDPATTAAPPPEAPTSTAPDLLGYTPTFEEGPCGPTVADDDRVDCGTLTVPLDRSAPGDGDVVLPVAVVRSAAPEPLPDPVVYFSGGPGGSALGFTRFVLASDLGGPRDVIVFDQRGTGAAEPSLDCPEVDPAVRQVLGTADPPGVELATVEDALLACRDRLVDEGIDLAQFSTPTTADDAEDLRRALGIEQWNLFGISYGTTVAIEVARRHPDPVRSVVLDSVYPPDVASSGARLVGVIDRALDALIQGCAADEACAAQHGDLRAELDALVEEWDDDPFTATVADPDGGELDVVITGADAVAGLWNAMYDSDLIPVLPSLVAPLRERGPFAEGVVAELVSQGIARLTGMAEGVTVTVDCADRQRLEDPDGGDAAFADRPDLASFAALAGRFGLCDRWGVPSVDPAFNHLGPGTQPTLVLAGGYDPVTPPTDGARVTGALGEVATFVELAPHGHGVVTADLCAQSLVAAFLDAPGEQLDTSCADELGPPAFVGG